MTQDNKIFMDWSDKNAYEAHVEGRLGSFNNTIPEQAMKKYDSDDNWVSFASMLTDIRRVCPMQDLARTAADNFAADVFSYVATQPRSKLGNIADSTSDIEALLGVYDHENEEQSKFVENMQHLFYTFVRTGKMPHGKDVKTGMYTVDDEITTQAHYQNCDFWKSAQKIVPSFADLN